MGLALPECPASPQALPWVGRHVVGGLLEVAGGPVAPMVSAPGSYTGSVCCMYVCMLSPRALRLQDSQIPALPPTSCALGRPRLPSNSSDSMLLGAVL